MLGIKPFKDLALCDDFIFSEVMRQPENVKPFLEDLLQQRIARVQATDKQKDLKDGYLSHGIRLDVYLEDEHNTKYDVEVQTTLRLKLEKRVRYYQSGIDRHTLETGEDYEELCDSYVIFICTDDYYQAGLAVYERESRIKDAPEIAYRDGSHVFILNANFTRGNAAPEILDFLRYVRAGYEGRSFDVSGSDYLSQIDRAVSRLKMSEGEESSYMTMAMKLMDERKAGRTEGLEAGMKAGRKEGLEAGKKAGMEAGKKAGRREATLRTVRQLRSMNMSLEFISEAVQLSLEEVKKLLQESGGAGDSEKNQK